MWREAIALFDQMIALEVGKHNALGNTQLSLLLLLLLCTAAVVMTSAVT
jgi:hypothetical protein